MGESKYPFQKLTPTRDANLNIYADALDFALSDNDIKNIAVTGAYSAGKSSIIETYKVQRPNLQCLHISLAHFENQASDTEDESKAQKPEDQAPGTKRSNLESLLEGKILNQLIHKISPNNIPRTNFKIKQNVTKVQVFVRTVLVAMLTLFLCYMGFFKQWSHFVDQLKDVRLKDLLVWSTNSSWLLVGGTFTSFMVTRVIYLFVKSHSSRNIFKRIKLQGNEIEIFEQSDDSSYFDKHLNEVLYLFKNCNAKIVVFEDIDRHNSNQIFERLREINTLINYETTRPRKRRTKRKQPDKQPIRFLYLLRDDIFSSKDRTKFFDFIIPVVPVLDGSNSYEQFLQHFEKPQWFELLRGNFLQNLSLYVDDMRLLKNIYNEFVIYHGQVSSINLRQDKLLALIAYKNIFPKDFSDLQLNQGYVFTLFNRKSEFTGHRIQEINDKVTTLRNQIVKRTSELLKSIDELDSVYLTLDSSLNIQIGGRREINYPSRAEFIRAIKDTGYEVTVVQNHIVRQTNISDRFKDLQNIEMYTTRRALIENDSNTYVEQLESEINSLLEQINALKNVKLKDLITNDNIDYIFNVNSNNVMGKVDNFEQIQASPHIKMVRFLVRNGHIDETYTDYLTYFYENSITRTDKNFLLSVTDREPKEYSYVLDNPPIVLSRLEIDDFSRRETLNFNLLTYITSNHPIYEQYLNRLLRQVMENGNVEFVLGYMSVKGDNAVLVQNINRIWPDIFQAMLLHAEVTAAQRQEYAVATLYYSADSEIVALNRDNCMSTFISQSPSFLNIEHANVERLLHGFSLLDVRFCSLDYDVSNPELFEAVYKQDLYELNFELISLILEKIYGVPKSRDYSCKNYSLIMSKPNEPLAEYANNNMDTYLNIMLENCDGQIEDDLAAVLGILNSEDVTLPRVISYINRLGTIIQHITDVKDKTYWSHLLDKAKVSYSEETVLNYFVHCLSKSSFDSSLITFLNSSPHTLSWDYNSIVSNYSKDTADEFFKHVVLCNELDNLKYMSILKALNRCHNNFQFDGINDDKVLILIDVKVITMTESNLTFMRETYSEQLVTYLVKNISSYVNLVVESDLFDFDEMLSLLDQNINDIYKIQLLECTDEPVSVLNKNYPDSVKIHILTNNLDTNDIEHLLQAYPVVQEPLQITIKSVAEANVPEICSNEYSLPFKLLVELLSSDKVEEQDKLELFSLHVEGLNLTEVINCLIILDLGDFVRLFDGKRPKFEINDFNRKLLHTFKQKQWITFEIDSNSSSHYRARGKKLNNRLVVRK